MGLFTSLSVPLRFGLAKALNLALNEETDRVLAELIDPLEEGDRFPAVPRGHTQRKRRV